jgi:hypothetical protein
LGATVLQIPDVPVSRLRNEGLRAARAAVIAFIDADNEIAPGWLAAALPHFHNPDVAAVGRDYSSPSTGTWVQRLYDTFRTYPARVERVRWLATGNMVVRRGAALQIDGFDETLETAEDFDFCKRLRLRGYEILADPSLKSTHYGDPATLADLFKGELWRGRDTLRVGLRGLNSWSELPSMLFPIAGLAAMAVGASGVALAWPIGSQLLWWPAGSVAVICGLSCVRAIRMLARARDARLGSFPGIWLIACVYDIARALALVVRVSHRGANASPRRSEVAA